MFDIKSFYEAKDVADAIRALEMDPDAEIISGGTDVLIRVREGKDAEIPGICPQSSGIKRRKAIGKREPLDWSGNRIFPYYQ